jgi:TPR repeat protein
MKRTINLSMLLIALIGSGSSFAGFNDGLVAAQNGDYAAAISNWKPLAIAGDANAQNNMGSLYRDGKGVTGDYAEAYAWYHMAAIQGNPEAQFNLGNMYKLGQGVPEDFTLAVSWYRKAADQGNMYAQNNMGSLYLDGCGVTRNPKTRVWPLLSSASERCMRRGWVSKRMRARQYAFT